MIVNTSSQRRPGRPLQMRYQPQLQYQPAGFEPSPNPSSGFDGLVKMLSAMLIVKQLLE
jgi:hypothetical protein